jgi:hypothetical protein
MILTLAEQKLITRRVLQSENASLTEADHNIDLQNEIKLNLRFYNEVKKGFCISESATRLINEIDLIGGVLSTLGAVKDIITGAKITKNIVELLEKIITPILDKLKKLALKYVPEPIRNVSNDIATGFADSAKGIADFIKKVYETLSYKGLAKLFAMIRYRTFRPTEKQKECMLAVAKQVYKYILIFLIVAFIIKMIVIFTPTIIVAIKSASTAATLTTAFAGFSNSVSTAFAAIGIKTLLFKIFSIISAALKAKDVKKLDAEIKAHTREELNTTKATFKDLWNECPLPKSNSAPGV